MNTLKLIIENCYGIKKLEHEFTYANHHTQLIYAANGMMKSSLALTLKGVSGQCKDKAKDRLHPTLRPKYEILADGAQLSKEQIFVADPEESGFDTSGVFTNFLADAVLKAQYDTIFQQLNLYVTQVINPLKEVSISSDCEDEILKTFTTNTTDNIFSILEQLALEVQAQHRRYSELLMERHLEHTKPRNYRNLLRVGSSLGWIITSYCMVEQK